MTKAKETLEHMAVNSPVKDLVLNGNINAICLSAMEEQAVKFIEWRENTPNVRRVGIDKWFYNGEYYTSKELYKLFNEL